MSVYEIEIKSLLGTREQSKKLKEKLLARGGKLTGVNKQLNHYFVGGKVEEMPKVLHTHISKQDQKKLDNIIEKGSNFSVRTRDMDGRVILVIKASVDDTTSDNGIARIEFEAEIPDMTIEELDQTLLDAGFAYQAKWSRSREEYVCDNSTVCVDMTPGYGYMAEFERVVGEEEDRNAIIDELRALMHALEVKELPQDRLERMFDHYNQHWPEYYGTDRIFVID